METKPLTGKDLEKENKTTPLEVDESQEGKKDRSAFAKGAGAAAGAAAAVAGIAALKADIPAPEPGPTPNPVPEPGPEPEPEPIPEPQPEPGPDEPEPIVDPEPIVPEPIPDDPVDPTPVDPVPVNSDPDPLDPVDPVTDVDILEHILAEEHVDENDIDVPDVINVDDIGEVYTVEGDKFLTAAVHDVAGNEMIMVDLDGDGVFDILVDDYGNYIADVPGNLDISDAQEMMDPEPEYLEPTTYDDNLTVSEGIQDDLIVSTEI